MSKWTDVWGTSCVDGAEFSTRDDHFYHGSVIANPHRASTDLQESGSATEAVLQRVVSIQVAQHSPRRMEGPAAVCIKAPIHDPQSCEFWATWALAKLVLCAA